MLITSSTKYPLTFQKMLDSISSEAEVNKFEQQVYLFEFILLILVRLVPPLRR